MAAVGVRARGGVGMAFERDRHEVFEQFDERELRLRAARALAARQVNQAALFDVVKEEVKVNG